jgi:phage-related protein
MPNLFPLLPCDISVLIYFLLAMIGRVLMVLRGEIKTPPMSEAARREAGFLLRRLQQGELLALPHSRPMPDTGPRCHELRINDANKTWRIMYRIDADAIIVVDVFEKKTQKTPVQIIANCKRRLRLYDAAAKGE